MGSGVGVEVGLAVGVVLCHATYSDISCTILYIMCIYNI